MRPQQHICILQAQLLTLCLLRVICSMLYLYKKEGFYVLYSMAEVLHES